MLSRIRKLRYRKKLQSELSSEEAGLDGADGLLHRFWATSESLAPVLKKKLFPNIIPCGKPPLTSCGEDLVSYTFTVIYLL